MELSRGKIKRTHDLLTSKRASCREITEKYLSAIKNDQLNAFVRVGDETALRTADIVDEKINRGEKISLLEGVPMTLKDNISTEGIETTCCSKMLKGYVPIYDASVWKILRRENAVLLGKANMDEFAMGSTCETSCFGGAKNPCDTSRVAGGSSGGVAAAVGGNMATYGLGSDTGGSIRQPASFCGVVGLKPTYGAVSRYGLIAYASGFDQIGPIACSVEDVAVVFDAISQYDPKDSTSKGKREPTVDRLGDDLKGIKIGVPKEYFEGIGEQTLKAINEVVELYKSLGAKVEYVDLPELKYALPVYYILACAEASSNLGRYDGIRYGYKTPKYTDLNDMICKTRAEGFGKEVKRRIMLGTYVLSAGYYDAYYKKAQNLRNVIIEAFDRVFDRFDVILAPTSASTAFKAGSASEDPVEAYLTDVHTVPVNIAGLPSVSIPCGFDLDGLPMGAQIIGPKFSEAKILCAAYRHELETDGKFILKADMGVKL